MAKSEPNFKAGSLVFAKLRGFPYWPARVESKVEGTYYVYFFGTHETTALNITNLLPFNEETKKKYGKVKRKHFAEAMDTIQTNPEFKADCVFNIPGTIAKKAPVAKPTSSRRTPKVVEPPKPPPVPTTRCPPKRRSLPEETEPPISKRESKEAEQTEVPKVEEEKRRITESNTKPDDVPVQTEKGRSELKREAVATGKTEVSSDRSSPVVYEYLNSERSPAEMGRLPLIKRREPPRDSPSGSTPVPVPNSPTAKEKSSIDQGTFSSPIKKRKLSPPKKAPERYLEDAPPRRNSAQRKESSELSRSAESSPAKVQPETKPLKIVKTISLNKISSEFQPGQLVFAKVKGHPFWPARIDKIASSAKPTKYQIFFFGTHEHAVLTSSNLIAVTSETKEKYGKPNKRSKFSEGLVEMQHDQWINFPGDVPGSTKSLAPSVTSVSVAPTALPPVTVVPQLNVQQTSPQSPQNSSQRTGSDKDDSDSFSDSSDSVGDQGPEVGQHLWRILGNK